MFLLNRSKNNLLFTLLFTTSILLIFVGCESSDTNALSATDTDTNTNTDSGTNNDNNIGDDTGADTSTDADTNTEEDPYFSYIWISNSAEGTVSKINTTTMIEEGRYQVRPDGEGQPSRTSVNIDGDVVVACRNGGVTKIIADTNKCNGKTSTGPNNVLPWGEDHCIAWHTPLDYPDNRPLAWTQGEQDPITKRWKDQKVWTSASQDKDGSIDVILLNGDNGKIEKTIHIPDMPQGEYSGGYGAAVDENGDLWMTNLGTTLAHVKLSDFTYELITIPHRSYGMTVDSFGYVWACDHFASRFDIKTKKWKSLEIPSHSQDNYRGGCMADKSGILWKANGKGFVGINIENMKIVEEIDLSSRDYLGSLQYIWGISIDFNENVWAIPRNLDRAFRVDTVSGTVSTVEGLVGAYTYSDMTGYALKSVTVIIE